MSDPAIRRAPPVAQRGDASEDRGDSEEGRPRTRLVVITAESPYHDAVLRQLQDELETTTNRQCPHTSSRN
jgi:hypothetical protein